MIGPKIKRVILFTIVYKKNNLFHFGGSAHSKVDRHVALPRYEKPII